MQLELSKVIDPTRPREPQIAALRDAVDACYCGLGPACYGWRQMTPDQRVQCSQDKRLAAQRLWKNGI
jgi:hypothetical protein